MYEIPYTIGQEVEVKKGPNKGKVFIIDCIAIWEEGIAVYDKKLQSNWIEEIKPIIKPDPEPREILKP